MRNKWWYLEYWLIVAVVATGCEPATEQKNNYSAHQEETVTSDLHCFLYSNNKDTILLKYSQIGNEVTGTLTYRFFNKDSNLGNISGTFHGDTLWLDYVFLSEGLLSIREVAFLKTPSGLQEGYGDMKEEKERMVFENRSSLSFTDSVVLKPGDC